MEILVSLPKTTPNIGEMLSSTLAKDREQNRNCLLKILRGLKYLARQGCAIRGDLGEGNLMQLMKVMSEDDAKVSLEKKIVCIISVWCV